MAKSLRICLFRGATYPTPPVRARAARRKEKAMSCSSEITVALPAPSRPRRPAGEGRRTAAEADDRPWERPGAVRRDCAPHRAGLLLAVADTSLLLGALSLPLGFSALMGLGLGVAGWALASRDLKRMRARVMDPAGRSR